MIRRTRGSFYIDALLGLMILMAVILSFLTIPEVFLKKQEVDYIARTVARRIEQDGRADGAVYALVADLADETGVDADVEWAGDFRGLDNKLQIREKFTVSVRYTVTVRIIDPTFTNPLFLSIPIRKVVSGVSEVYWKELV
jgi:hypothetical protein